MTDGSVASVDDYFLAEMGSSEANFPRTTDNSFMAAISNDDADSFSCRLSYGSNSVMVDDDVRDVVYDKET